MPPRLKAALGVGSFVVTSLLFSGWAVAGLVHALGHVVAARVLGVPATFSLGTGPPAWEHGGLRISALPGAYVAPRLEGVGAVRVGLYLLAGPVASVVGAWLLIAGPHAVGLMIGEPDQPSVVGNVAPGSPTDAAAIRAGDRVVAVEESAVAWWSDLTPALEGRSGPMVLTLEREGRHEVARLDVAAGAATGLSARRLAPIVGVDDPASDAGRAGLRTGDEVVAVDGAPVADWGALVRALDAPGPKTLTLADDRVVTLPAAPATPRWGVEPVELFVGEALPGGGAARAGLRRGDQVERIDGRAVSEWAELVAAVSASEGRALTLQVRRDGEARTVTVAPSMPDPDDFRREQRPFVGLAPWEGIRREAAWETRVYGPVEALAGGAARARQLFGYLPGQLVLNVAGEPPRVESLGGPVEIYRRTEARPPSPLAFPRAIAGMLATTSLLLGLYNLLPLPFSDGFTALDTLVHRVWGRRLRHRTFVIAAGLAFAGLVVFIFVMDLRRALTG